MAIHGRKLILTAGIFTACLACAPAYAGSNEYSLGVEGYYDQYHEPGGDLETQSGFGSITGNYTHDWNAFFAALDGRASYGLEDYQSISGTINNMPAWEFEGRLRGGYDFRLGGGSSISPYLGAGVRYYWEEGKGETTNLGAEGYDRKITQIYIPIGFTYTRPLNEAVTISPNLEYDQFVWGHVSSRLGSVPGNMNEINIQSNGGWGLRGSVMMGWQQFGLNWQAGPFVRYWDISESNISDGGEEPENTRLQVGLALRVLW